MEKCQLCGDPLTKKGIAKGRKLHYGCKCVEKFAKNGGNTCQTRLEKAMKTLNSKKPGLLANVFGL